MRPITEIKAEGEPADDGGGRCGNDGWSFGFCFHRQTVAPTHYYVGCLPSHLISFRRAEMHPPPSQTSGRLKFSFRWLEDWLAPGHPARPNGTPLHSAQLAAPFRQPSFVTPPNCYDWSCRICNQHRATSP